MRHKLFALTLLALAAFVGYVAHAGFPTIVPLVAATAPSARIGLAPCEANVVVAERGPDLSAANMSPRAETVGSADGWLLDPRPMMGR
jgi:hypothetical protein